MSLTIIPPSRKAVGKLGRGFGFATLVQATN
jgi:hypothetical protein